MGILQGFLGTRYSDERIVQRAKWVIAEDPITAFPSPVRVSCQDGVVILIGKLNSESEKEHVEDVVRAALKGSKLSFRRIENALEVE